MLCDDEETAKQQTAEISMKRIEFETSSEGKPNPLEAPRGGSGEGGGFKSLVFKDEYWKRAKKFSQDVTWLRMFPAIKGSTHDWMLRLEVYADKAGVTFVSPKTFDERIQDPFEKASRWLRKNKPDTLYSRDKNPNGFKLWSMPYGLAWVFDEAAPEGERLGLLFKSLYDGVRGGTSGLGYRIKAMAEERDTEPGSQTVGEFVHGDIVAPEAGRLVKVTRTKADGQEFASYSVGVGKQAYPMGNVMEKLSDDEANMVCPLENIVYVPTEDEIHGILKGYIGETLYAEIFGE